MADDLRQRLIEAIGACERPTMEDLADAVMAVRDGELERLRAVVANYEQTINWLTTCQACARTLDGAYRETVRAENAERRLARVRVLAEQWVAISAPTTRAAGRAVLAALDDSKPETRKDG